MSNDILLTQYKVFADRRLHFGKMFWQNIAFIVGVLLALAAIFRDAAPDLQAWLMLGGGAATLQMSYIAHRVRLIEDDCEKLMHEIEQKLRALAPEAQLAPLSHRFGARAMTVASLAALGLGLAALGATRLAG